MVYYVAKAVEERRQAAGGRWVTGGQLIQTDGGFDFQGFNQVSGVNTCKLLILVEMWEKWLQVNKHTIIIWETRTSKIVE